MRTILLLAVTLPVLAQEPDPKPVAPAPAPAPAPESENDARWHPLLLKLAEGYRVYGRIDDESRFAPYLCRMPLPGDLLWSKADKDTPHAAKLYTLYVKDPVSYGGERSAFPKPFAGDEACAQVVVKESWSPEKMDPPPDSRSLAQPLTATIFGPSGLRPAERGGSWYRAKEPQGLFIMAKVGAASPGTDEGWIYGTVTADGKTVTGSGRIASCMACHVKAPRDRLFGLPKRN